MPNVTPMGVPIEMAERNLKELLQRVHLGEAITLIDPEGTPLAVMVSLKRAPVEAKLTPDWEARWDALAQKISCAWKSDKGAVETFARDAAMNCTIDASDSVAAARVDEEHYPASRQFLTRAQAMAAAGFCPTLVLAECAPAIARPTGAEALTEEIVTLWAAQQRGNEEDKGRRTRRCCPQSL